MTRPPQQPPPGLTAIHGQLHVPPRAFPPHSLPGKIQKAIGALTVQNRHLHYGFAQASTWGGHVAKEPLGKYVTRNYGKEKNNLVFPRNTENLFWAFWKGLYCGYSFFFLVSACLRCLLLDSELLQWWGPALLIPVKQWLVWHPGCHKPCRSSESGNGEMESLAQKPRLQCDERITRDRI